jgi:general secretion pathway protein M
MGRELNDREKKIVLGGGIAAALLILFGLIIIPFNTATKRYEREIKEKSEKLAMMIAFQDELKSLRDASNAGSIPVPPANFTLLTFLENLAIEAGIKEKITKMKPSSPEIEGGLKTTAVEIKLEKLDLEQLVSFLYKVEKNRQIAFKTKRLVVKTRFDNKQLLDATFQVINIVPNNG